MVSYRRGVSLGGRSMKSKRIACVLAGIGLIAFLESRPIHAATVTYYYVGNYFNTFGDDTPPVGSYTSSDFVSGSVTLQDPLPINFHSGYLPPTSLSFSFSDGRNTITNLNYFGASIVLNTGASGQIIDWYIDVRTDPATLNVVGGQYFEISARTDATGDYGWFFEAVHGVCPEGFSPPCNVTVDQAAVPNSPGRWSGPIPETPLPAALPLFATGLGGLGLLGWHRKRKAAALAA